MKIKSVFRNHILESSKLSKDLLNKIDEITKICIYLKKKIKNKNKIFVFGNGGSFADGSHFVGELISTYKIKRRKPLPFIMLSSNIPALTAWANDFNYNTFLTREIEALSSNGDVLILISTSGGNIKKKQSINLINLAKFAKKKKIDVISFMGKKNGSIAKYSKIVFNSQSNKTPIIQENQHMIFHLISDFLDREFK